VKPVSEPSTASGEASRLSTIRRGLRRARRALSTRDQRLHAKALKRLLGREPTFLAARRLAAYWPADGELDPQPLLAVARLRGRRTYLPVLRGPAQGRLWFLPYRPGEPLRLNRYGIPEPRRRREHIRLAWHLDLLLVPLVGFDGECNRLGMGGGFYDRTLAYLRQRTHWRRPRLIGIAHACQRLDRIDPRPWDIPLDGVATEERIYWRRGRRPST
jgi:5-formyltetrahydrofolate cyclo-ligase